MIAISAVEIFDSQRGVVLVSVLVGLALLAALLLGSNVRTSAAGQAAQSHHERVQLNLLAEAAMQKMLWQLHSNTSCNNYADLAAESFASGSIEASISPNSGSPVEITAEATGADGVTVERVRSDQTMYDLLQTTTIRLSDGGFDTFIEGESGHFDHNKDGDKSLEVRGDAGKFHRALLKFDVSALPPGAHIESATLQLNQTTSSGAQADAVAYPIVTPWVSANVTWLETDTASDWLTPGGDFDERAGTRAPTSADGVVAFDMTSLVRAWHSAALPNNGLLLKSTSEGATTVVEYDSSDGGGGVEPTLVIDYRCECGIACAISAAEPNLVAHWKLDESSGDTARDSVGANDGKLENGPSWGQSGVIDGALEFDGSNDQVRVPHDDSLSFKDELSISAWIYNTDSGLPGSYRILSKETDGRNDNYFVAVFGGGEVVVGVGDDFYQTFDLRLSANQWYHLAVTYFETDGELLLYINGVEAESWNTSSKIDSNSDPLYLGNNHEGKAWQGLLDDVRLYNRTLSAAEIQAQYSANAPEVDPCSNYADNLSSISFAGSDGVLSWSEPWEEVGESDGPGSGDVRIRMEGGELALRIRDNQNGGEGVERNVDLSAMPNAALSYYFARQSLDNSSDYVAVEISAKGSEGPWTELTRHAGPNNESGFFDFARFDISAFISSDTRLRFISSPTMGNTDTVYFDDFLIECSP